MPEACPVCGSVHDTYTAVAMHMCKTNDDSHPWDTQNEALEYLAEQGLIGVGSSGEGSVVDTSDDETTDDGDTSEPAEPTAADGGNPLVGDADPEAVEPTGEGYDAAVSCCDDPTLAGSRGMLVIGANHDAERLAGQVRKQPIQLDTVDLDAPMRLEGGDRICMNCDEIHEGVSN